MIIGAGLGDFDESVITNANFANPTRRDVATMPASGFGSPTGGYIVIGFNLNNPGAWVPLLLGCVLMGSCCIVILRGINLRGWCCSLLNGLMRFRRMWELRRNGMRIVRRGISIMRNIIL